MEELKVLKQNAVEAYSKADSGGKSLLSNLFGKTVFIADMKEWEAYIMPRVTSFETACAETGEDPKAGKFTEGEPDEIAYKRGKVIVRALNGPHVLDWKNGNQRKWQAWLEYDGTGFRFDDSRYADTYSSAASGSRLRLCSEVLAKYFATQFPDLMMPFWL
jgi:hypothetical protein